MKRAAEIDLIKLGLRIRQVRKSRALTLDALARRIGLTKSLLSKVENFRAIPSLPVLAKIAQGLHVDMAELVKDVTGAPAQSYTLVRASERAKVERDDAIGFLYEALMTRPAGDMVFEAFVLTLKPNARRPLIATEGEQFVFVLDGQVEFIYGKEAIKMARGDAIFFDGRVPHVSRNHARTPATLLAIYLVKHGTTG